MRKKCSRSVQIRPRTYLHTACSYVYRHPCTRNYVYIHLHTDDDFLSRIRGSMNGPWTINGPYATHTHSLRALSASPLPPSPPLPPPRLYKHARALTRSLRPRTTITRDDDAYTRNYSGIHTRALFFPSFLCFLFSLTRARRIGRRKETSSLAGLRPRDRACIFTHSPKGESAVLGKAFSKGTCENRLDRAPECEIKLAVPWMACHCFLYRSIVGFTLIRDCFGVWFSSFFIPRASLSRSPRTTFL